MTGARTLSIVRVVTLSVALASPLVAQAGDNYASRCGVSGPPAERGSYLPLPRGDVFCPLIADPKATRSFAGYQRGNQTDLATNIAAVGIADQFSFFRADAAVPGNGVQLGIAGGVFAQFDMRSQSYDLLNADYMVGLPLTFRYGRFSGRLRPYHQSSHLGDEFLLRINPPPPTRVNLSFESVEGLFSADIMALRVYGGGEYFVGRDPIGYLPNHLLHAGTEVRPRASLGVLGVATIRVVAAADVKVVAEPVTRTGVSARFGFEFARPSEAEVGSRRWSLLGEYYTGPSPYGQFLVDQVRLTGIGFHFTP